jgi:Uma2 family endonuclease
VPADTALVVEVAYTSLREDREGTVRFARAGIPVAWVVDVVGRAVEVYSDPGGPSDPPGYRKKDVYSEGDEVPVVVGGREVGRLPVGEMLPRAGRA